MRHLKRFSIVSAVALTAPVFLAAPAAAKDEPLNLISCDESLGSVALVEGDTRGWKDFGLGSPHALLDGIVTESGCFTMYQPGAAGGADFNLNVIAGTKEEVDKSIRLATRAAHEAIWKSGAGSKITSELPVGRSLLGALGMFGGKKKTVSAGIRIVDPSNGTTLAAGSGTVKKSTLTWGGSGGWRTGAQMAGYDSKTGKMLTEAFIIAFNRVVAQKRGQ